MECNTDTKQVRVYNIEGDPGPAGPMGPPGPAGTGSLIYDNLSNFPTDGSALIAYFQPEFGINRNGGVYADRICCFFAGGNAPPASVLFFTNAERTQQTSARLQPGWVVLYF